MIGSIFSLLSTKVIVKTKPQVTSTFNNLRPIVATTRASVYKYPTKSSDSLQAYIPHAINNKCVHYHQTNTREYDNNNRNEYYVNDLAEHNNGRRNYGHIYITSVQQWP